MTIRISIEIDTDKRNDAIDQLTFAIETLQSTKRKLMGKSRQRGIGPCEKQSGVKGINWDKNNSKWRVRVWDVKRKAVINVGLFADLDDAILAFDQAGKDAI